MTRAVITSGTDGRVLVWPVSTNGLGQPRELCRFEPAAIALSYVDGEVLAAAGNRLVRITREGVASTAMELDSPIHALAARHDRVGAIAGAALHVADRIAGEWRILQRIDLPTATAHDLDIDRKGKRAYVGENPHSGWIFDVETGANVGRVVPAQWLAKRARETYARFSPVTDHVYVAYSGAHHVLKCSAKGRRVAELGTSPSTWCTPIATSLDGRWLVSRQSGIGVIAWDLTTEAELLFAELDYETPHQSKFEKRMAVTPAAVKSMGQGAIKVTRWRAVPELEGEATAIGVAPDCAYLATGDRHGRVTLIDVATRRIERSDGVVLQRGGLRHSLRVPNGEQARRLRVGDELVFVAKDGEMTSLDLATGSLDVRGKIEIGGTFAMFGHGGDLVLIEGTRANCINRATLETRWSWDDALPKCTGLAFDGTFLIGLEDLGGEARALRRFDPAVGKERDRLPVTLAGARLRTDEVSVEGCHGHNFVSGWCHDGRFRRFPLRDDGTLASPLDDDAVLLPGFEHVITCALDGWTIRSTDNLDEPMATAKVEHVTLGGALADVSLHRVVAQDMHTKVTFVFTLEGVFVDKLDAIGPVEDHLLGPTEDSLWILERGGMIRAFTIAKGSEK